MLALRAAAGLALCALPAQDFPFFPGARHEPTVPTAQAVLGHPLGEELTISAEAERYLRALAAASPRLRLVTYGASWQGRPLVYAIVSAPENLARLDAIKAGMQRLADPRALEATAAQRLLAELPAVAWLGYTVHGDEPSGTDAALALAYHLAAGEGDPLLDTILREVVVLIDPVQNPDGRDRFVHSFTTMRGRWPDAEPDAAEHHQPWPGGRSNHYWFDMNRDWFAQTQPETRARVRVYREWWPLVVADLHEMGSNSTYYFAPPADPINPEISPAQRAWFDRFGRNNAAWFDRFGIPYFVREHYDCFYPGYADGWPTLQGSIGMTYEQGSVRGLRMRREDEVEVHYRDCVRHHFIASLATLETLAQGRAEALAAFLDCRRSAIEEGSGGALREFLLPPGRDPLRTRKLVRKLLAQGIEVAQATGELRNGRTRDYHGGAEAPRTLPAATFVVRLAQPQKRLAVALLAPRQDLDRAFLEEQLRKQARRADTDFYDLTAWSLPLLYDVEAYTAAEASTGELRAVTEAELAPELSPFAAAPLPPAKVAWLVPWGSNAGAALVAALLRDGVRVHSAAKRFTRAGRPFPAGTALVRVAGNGDPEALHARLQELRGATGAEVVAADSSWVDAGVSFGSNDVRWLRRPRIALACDRPTSSTSTGWTRWLLEQEYGLPVTMVRTRHLPRARLVGFDVIVLPDGDGPGYGDEIGKAGAERLKAWIADGGTLVTLGDATHWLTGKDVGLLATEAEPRKVPGVTPPAEPPPAGGEAPPRPPEPAAARPEPPFDYAKAILPQKERPPATPGAILRVRTDPDHWLAFGYPGHTNMVSSGRNIYTPVKLDQGVNVAVFEAAPALLVAGFAWDDKLAQLAHKAFVVHQPHGRGHVVAFAEDPNVRGFVDGLHLLFLNAVLLGPGH